MNSLQEKFLEFNKNYENIKDFNIRLDKMSMKEYVRVKPEMHLKISSIPVILNDINSITNRITSSEIKDIRLRNNAYEKMKIVEEKIISKNNELNKMMNDIVEKERMMFNKNVDYK